MTPEEFTNTLKDIRNHPYKESSRQRLIDAYTTLFDNNEANERRVTQLKKALKDAQLDLERNALKKGKSFFNGG